MQECACYTIIYSQIGNLSYQCDGICVFEDCIGTGSHRVLREPMQILWHWAVLALLRVGAGCWRTGGGDEIKPVLQDGVNRELK